MTRGKERKVLNKTPSEKACIFVRTSAFVVVVRCVSDMCSIQFLFHVRDFYEVGVRNFQFVLFAKRVLKDQCAFVECRIRL